MRKNAGLRYYACVTERDGKIYRVARLGRTDGGFVTDGWEKDHWEDMPGLIKIEHDITDFYAITKEEADAICAAQKEGKTDLAWQDYIAELRP